MDTETKEIQIRWVKECDRVKQQSGNVEQYIKDYPARILLPKYIDDFYISQIKEHWILWYIMSTRWMQTILWNGNVLYPLHDIHIYSDNPQL